MGRGKNPGPEFPAWPTLVAMSALERSRVSWRVSRAGGVGMGLRLFLVEPLVPLPPPPIPAP